MHVYKKTIPMFKSFNNDITTYEELIKIYNDLSVIDEQRVLFDMTKTQFIAANLFSVLGCILHTLSMENSLTFTFRNIHPKIKNVMQRNGFSKIFRLDTIKDPNNTTIEYKIFNATTENLVEFEKYTILNIINRNDMPEMSALVRDRIVDNILEIFNNVIDHAETSKAFVCGQYFVSKKKLVITITDIGKTIKENVTEYLSEPPYQAIKWAIVPGNSTKSTSAPGGLGISMLLDFLKLNKGLFTLISANECLEINEKGERFIELKNSFPGTIVSITFNMNDDFSYILNSEKEDAIIF